MKSASRITLDMSLRDVVIEMSDGNPGGLNVCMLAVKDTPAIDPDAMMGGLGTLLSLDSLGIYGSRIYCLWSDVCGRDLTKTLALLRAYRLGQLAGVTEAALNHAIDNRGAGLDVDAALAEVKAKLPKFGRATEAAVSP